MAFSRVEPGKGIDFQSKALLQKPIAIDKNPKHTYKIRREQQNNKDCNSAALCQIVKKERKNTIVLLLQTSQLG